RKNGARVEWDVTLPPNSTATIYVPARSGNDVTESGASAAEAQGLRFSRMENGNAVFEAASGRYHFQSVTADSGGAAAVTGF
ncbi:MAG TPA: alpha-L-rhamnosidase C-terminal domain-containing protein, partial [Bryobacteraceae bacterium]|nr:alpha-L-rhamnosidase C-terminal domain-containing protein [Bryobacteraceae bacterium]